MLPPGGKPWLLFGLLGASLATNLVMALWWPDCEQDCAPALQVEAGPEPSMDPANPATAEADPGATMMDEPVAAPADLQGYSVIHGVVEANLARTFQDLGIDSADAVSAVFSRQFAWDLDLRRDLQKGDTITAVYKIGADGEIDMPLAWFDSNKLGKALEAYRFTAPGDEHPSYWYADGTEVPYRLENAPIAQYVQITSLLDDRRGHEGWDFKAPEGTPITSPKAGRVERANWNHAMNGNCIEVVQSDGVRALYLHLSRNDVKPGDSVSAGQQIGLVGNTGRSTSAHLHYQLEKGDKVLDPAQYHGTLRRTLPPEALPAFQQEMARMKAMVEAG
jgi:murein DD-endopeptidase MepM/ murein hydrolase activator NlpD